MVKIDLDEIKSTMRRSLEEAPISPREKESFITLLGNHLQGLEASVNACQFDAMIMSILAVGELTGNMEDRLRSSSLVSPKRAQNNAELFIEGIDRLIPGIGMSPGILNNLVDTMINDCSCKHNRGGGGGDWRYSIGPKTGLEIDWQPKAAPTEAVSKG
jgi:hypothetical protein